MSENTKIKVLCVEDEQDIRENISDVLRDEGFEVFEADNGKRGFESFMQNKPDIVISDIMMPEMDGYDLLKLVRESKNVRNNTVPFIFLSALGQKDNVIKGANSSANDYLVKPIDFDVMIAKIKEKTSNSNKIKAVHTRDIKNIKNQVSLILPSELFSYLDVISQVTSILKDEPYGPLPHRRYLEDINKIYMNATKLRSSIVNAMDSSVIDHKLNAEEEIFVAVEFLQEFVGNLSEKFRSKITVEPPFEPKTTPRVKLDPMVLLDALRKIFAGLFKTDPKSSITVSIMVDHLDQMVIIFYLNTKLEDSDIKNNLDEAQIGVILDKQNCRFEIAEATEHTAVLVIPSYRLIGGVK